MSCLVKCKMHAIELSKKLLKIIQTYLPTKNQLSYKNKLVIKFIRIGIEISQK